MVSAMTRPAITPDTPLRLADAVAAAFPAGGMTPEVYRKHYAHHHPDHMSGAVRALSGRE